MPERTHRLPVTRFRAVVVLSAALVAALAGACALPPRGTNPPSTASSPRPTSSTPTSSTPVSEQASSAAPPVYVHYYLWWTTRHWQDTLGPAYPYGANPAPAPGSFAASGCGPTVAYSGSKAVDVPADGLYDQSDPAVFDRQIAQAASAGIRGFVVSWQGTGTTSQAPSSNGYDTRLDMLVQRVDVWNATHTPSFGLALGMSAFGDYARPSAALVADLTYFADRYGSDPAFVNPFSSRPMVMVLASRSYTGTQVADAAGAVGTRLTLIGDETNTSWPQDAPYLAGTSWYWSSQNPYANPHSGAQIASLADQVHAQHKLWFAPFAPGYDKELSSGTACTPRNGTTTLSTLWAMNAPSRPDGWFGISWNEFVENTYLQPSALYGSAALDTLRGLIAAQQ